MALQQSTQGHVERAFDEGAGNAERHDARHKRLQRIIRTWKQAIFKVMLCESVLASAQTHYGPA